jgi:hypothetical protein
LNGEELAIEIQSPAKNRGIAAEVACRKRVAQQNDRLGTGLVIVWTKFAAQNWLYTQCREQTCRYFAHRQTFRLSLSGEVEVLPARCATILSKTVFIFCQSAKFAKAMLRSGTSRDHSDRYTIRLAGGYGKGRSNTVFATEKMAVLAPMPSASVRTATMYGQRALLKRPGFTLRAPFFVSSPVKKDPKKSRHGAGHRVACVVPLDEKTQSNRSCSWFPASSYRDIM